MSRERLAHQRRGDSAAAERHDRAGRRREQLAHDLLLELAERALAVRREVVVDALAEPLLDDRVGVDRAPAERRRDRTRGGRLAGAHEADEGERALAYGRRRFHPIRSS
jgi:hypothetical protein